MTKVVPPKEPSRDLVGQGLACTCGHDSDTIVSSENPFNQRLLSSPEIGVAKGLVQHGSGPGAGGWRGRCRMALPQGVRHNLQSYDQGLRKGILVPGPQSAEPCQRRLTRTELLNIGRVEVQDPCLEFFDETFELVCVERGDG